MASLLYPRVINIKLDYQSSIHYKSMAQIPQFVLFFMSLVNCFCLLDVTSDMDDKNFNNRFALKKAVCTFSID